jgi:flagellar protein FlbD
MILVTRSDGSELLVNPDCIQTIEETPDTVLTLVDGKKLIVREAAAVIAERFCTFHKFIRSDGRFGGRRKSDPPSETDPTKYHNPNRATLRLASPGR